MRYLMAQKSDEVRIYLKEDNNFKDDSLTQRQRLGHIHSVLAENNLNIYRRHIASRV